MSTQHERDRTAARTLLDAAKTSARTAVSAEDAAAARRLLEAAPTRRSSRVSPEDERAARKILEAASADAEQPPSPVRNPKAPPSTARRILKATRGGEAEGARAQPSRQPVAPARRPQSGPRVAASASTPPAGSVRPRRGLARVEMVLCRTIADLEDVRRRNGLTKEKFAELNDVACFDDIPPGFVRVRPRTPPPAA